MAELLIEQWRLAVLRVHLDVTTTTPEVVSELVSYAGGSPRWLWTRRHPVEAFGLTSSREPPVALRVPSDLRDGIARTLQTDLRGEASLWVRLAPPYGYLGAVPWEAALLDVIDLPVLRVPDRLPTAADAGRVWSVAVAVSAQPDTTWAAPYVMSLVRRLGEQIGPDVEVDVFADVGTHAQLTRSQGPTWLHVHPPTSAREASRTRIDQIRSSPYVTSGTRSPIDLSSPGRVWADWIASGLAGRAVRALHVVLDTAWDAEAPMLALSRDPSKPVDLKSCTFVSGDDVRRLADALGAATLSFGSPPDAAPEEAMRMIADMVGQQRPGTTLFSSIRDDADGGALAAMHAYLSGHGPALPRHRSLFAYLQPEQAQRCLAEPWPQPSPSSQVTRSPEDDPLPSSSLPETYRADSKDADLTAYLATASVVPTWVASSERFVDQQLASLSRSATTPESVDYKKAYERGAAEGLAELSAIVAKYAKRS